MESKIGSYTERANRRHAIERLTKARIELLNVQDYLRKQGDITGALELKKAVTAMRGVQRQIIQRGERQAMPTTV